MNTEGAELGLKGCGNQKEKKVDNNLRQIHLNLHRTKELTHMSRPFKQKRTQRN